MRRQKLLSIVVNNHNYAAFVGAAVASALEQNTELTETIVVDDGSTDESRQIIKQFADRATVIHKTNGGQASALNAGYAKASGDWVLFLDADDILLPGAAEHLASVKAHEVSKVTWTMPVIGPAGQRLSGCVPSQPISCGDQREALLRHGPLSFTCAPCSGNAWSRDFLDAVMPMPEEPFRRGADGYLLQLSPIFGATFVMESPLSVYRRHGGNFLAAKSEFEIRDVLRNRYPTLCQVVTQQLANRGLSFDSSSWRHRHWDRLDELELAIQTHIPAGSSFVLVDDDCLNVGNSFHGRPRRHLMECERGYAGSPHTSAPAIEQLCSLNEEGAHYLAVSWYSFWWLDYYQELREFLHARGAPLHRGSTCFIYGLKGASTWLAKPGTVPGSHKP